MTTPSLATVKGRTTTPAPEIQGQERPNEPLVALPETTVQRSIGSRWSLLLKQWLDFAIAAMALLLTAPLFVVIAALIKLTSHGPVLYMQKRVGQAGRVFRFYKFRTMQHNSDDSVHREFSRNFIRGNGDGDGNNLTSAHGPNGANGDGVLSVAPANGNGNGNGAALKRARDDSENGSVYKLTADPRVTRIGQFLRRTSLDELPQLINVIRGEMSLVGPRPPVVYELEHYQDWHKRRLRIKPGITGLWQVSGRSSVPFDEMVQLDLYYIEHRSTLMDLWIMARTLPAMVRGDGAY